jgi:steroid 5-alpha reductase family enzyme
MVSLIIFLVLSAISFVFWLIAAWTKNIIIIDCLIIAIIVGVAIKNQFQIHSAFCFLIGFATFTILALIQYGIKIGFWLIALLMSVGWGLIFALFTYAITEYNNGKPDYIWSYVMWFLGFIVALLLHIADRKRFNASAS